jgi:hypothetical protein
VLVSPLLGSPRREERIGRLAQIREPRGKHMWCRDYADRRSSEPPP